MPHPSTSRSAVLRVRDVMNDNVLTVQDTDPARLAVQMMLWGGFRHLPVLRGKELVGIITDRDVYEAEMRDEATHDTPVADLMKSDVHTASPDDPIGEAARAMAAAHIHAMPVVERGRLVGIVTSHDLLACLAHGALPKAPAVVSARVSDVMCREPRLVRADDDLRTALALMVDQQIRHLPVVDDSGALVGIVSDRDVRAAVGDPVEALRYDDSAVARLTVADVMTPNPIAISPDAPLEELGWSLLDEKVGAVPVVDDEDRLMGIVSYVDVLHFALRGLS